MNRYPLTISVAKVVHYLLNPNHVDGRWKAKFLLSFGFTIEHPEILAMALLQQGEADPVEVRQTEWGPRYRIEAPLPSPDERNPMVRTIWQPTGRVEHLAQFVSMIPMTGKRRLTVVE